MRGFDRRQLSFTPPMPKIYPTVHLGGRYGAEPGLALPAVASPLPFYFAGVLGAIGPLEPSHMWLGRPFLSLESMQGRVR